jgi:hypothetical protein
MTDAVRRYKEIVGELTAVAEELREKDKAQATALARRLVELDSAMVRAEERAALSRLAVEIRWEMVLDALWDQQWMTLKPHPRPDPGADGERLDDMDREADLAANDVIAAARNRFPFLR